MNNITSNEKKVEKSNQALELVRQKCVDRHERLDDSIHRIRDDLSKIKENHIDHLEKDVNIVRETQVKILTILDERLPRK